MLVFLQILERWVYMDPIHGPLDGPLYMGSIYTNTLSQSELPMQRCSRLDKKKVQKANTPPAQPQLATGYVEATLRLERNSENVEEGRPLVKMSAN